MLLRKHFACLTNLVNCSESLFAVIVRLLESISKYMPNLMMKGDNQLWPVNRLALSKLSGRKIQMIKTYKNCMNVVHYILSRDHSFRTYAKLHEKLTFCTFDTHTYLNNDKEK